MSRIDRILEVLDVGDQGTTPEHHGFAEGWVLELDDEQFAAFLAAVAASADAVVESFDLLGGLLAQLAADICWLFDNPTQEGHEDER